MVNQTNGRLNPYTLRKRYSTTTERLGNNVKNFTIPVSFGNIAGKAWGKETGYPVLALHGWLDNCGTFDNLFPLLSDKLYIVAIDAPGHGMSSHKAPGSFYSDISMIIDFKKVIDFLGWQNFSIIAHSMGGSMALMFAGLFPEIIQKLAVVEIVKPSSRDLSFFPGETIKVIKNLLEIEKKLFQSPPVYTPEEAAKKLQESMFNEVTLESARIMSKRGTRPSDCGKGVVFSRDMRCKTMEEFSRRSHDYVRQFMSAVKCELLMIMAKNTNPIYTPFTIDVIDSFYDIYRKNTKKFILEHVDGNHFVHLNNPERIAPFINQFFSDV